MAIDEAQIDKIFKDLFTRSCDVVEACLGDERPLMANKIKKILLDEGNMCKRLVIEVIKANGDMAKPRRVS